MQYYDKALAINPTNVNALLNKSSILDGLGKYHEARSYYDKSLNINPNLTSIMSEKELTAFNKLMNNNSTKQ